MKRKINDFTFLIPVRKGSVRVKNKNIRKFHNSNLLNIKINQLKRIFKNPRIIVSTDCKKSIKIAKKNDAIIDRRPKKYCTSKIPMREVYKYFGRIIKTKFVCYTNVTSPLISDSSIRKIFYKFFNKSIDSITTTHKTQEYLWSNLKPLNYNPNNHPKSQDLKSYDTLNFAFSIVETEYMKLKGKIFGKKFLFYNLSFPEYIDIDNMKDFVIAEYIYKNKKKFLF
jgi:CMP-N-acetylneuraminic acid synthetase